MKGLYMQLYVQVHQEDLNVMLTKMEGTPITSKIISVC